MLLSFENRVSVKPELSRYSGFDAYVYTVV